MEKERKNWVRIIMMILAFIAFIIITVGAAERWYQIGGGISYDKQLTSAGLTHQQSMKSSTHELRVDRAKRDGAIYSVLMINGTYLPLFVLILIIIYILSTPTRKEINKKSLVFLPAAFFWGVIFSGFAHHMISSSSLIEEFLGSSIIWLGFTALFGILFALILKIRKKFAR